MQNFRQECPPPSPSKIFLPSLEKNSINRKVGKFTATAIITRVGPGDVDEELCFEIPYEITDTDECMLPVGQPMRHKCHGSTVCRNTLGSYECE